MREIPLSRGQTALVDDEDYERVAMFKWKARWDPDMGSYYAVRTIYLGRKDKKSVYSYAAMHREILGLKLGDPRKGDHVEPSKTLDNRRSNLRISTHAQNICNFADTDR